MLRRLSTAAAAASQTRTTAAAATAAIRRLPLLAVEGGGVPRRRWNDDDNNNNNDISGSGRSSRKRYFSSDSATSATATTTSGDGADNNNNNNNSNDGDDGVGGEKIPVRWLDLRGSGLSVLERLLLEECLLRHDEDDTANDTSTNDTTTNRRHHNSNWIIVGHHEANRHRYLSPPRQEPRRQPKDKPKGNGSDDDGLNFDNDDHSRRNDTAVIVMGIGGKPESLLRVDDVVRDGVTALRRFSGGGTVVLDHDSIWTTVIGRPRHFERVVEPFPRKIMEWSADVVFGPLFRYLQEEQQSKAENNDSGSGERGTRNRDNNANKRQQQATLVLDTKSCSTEVTGRVVSVLKIQKKDGDNSSDNDNGALPGRDEPRFALRENDYALGERKMGGNAQAIAGRSGWLHHTSFLWDYRQHNMDYLTIPDKRPEYRQDKDHDEFLVKLRDCYPDLSKADFYACLKRVCEEQFELRTATLRDAMRIVSVAAAAAKKKKKNSDANSTGGGDGGGSSSALDQWYKRGGRTKVVSDLLR